VLVLERVLVPEQSLQLLAHPKELALALELELQQVEFQRQQERQSAVLASRKQVLVHCRYLPCFQGTQQQLQQGGARLVSY